MTVLALGAAVLGLLVGSFLNVVIWRVPRGESLLRPGSHCPSCGESLRWRDNVPVLSWLLLRGRCRTCQAHISPRYVVVEVLTGTLFAALALRHGPEAALPAHLYLAAVGIALAVIDIDVQRLPDALTLPSYGVALGLLGIAALVDGEPGQWLRAVLAMAALFTFYFLVALLYPAGMGFGDVKLAGLIGLYLGWLGWGPWFVGAFGAFLLGGTTAIALVVAGRAGRGSAIPFGPFMLLGALVAVFAGNPLASAYLDLAAR